MSEMMALEQAPPVSARLRLGARLAVVVAFPLSLLGPRHVETVLCRVRRGAEPATYEQAATARAAVVAVSTHCAGQGCLRRSLATALLCRMHGTWPTWCTGVRIDPFRAHAWVEAGGFAVSEPHPPGYYAPVITVSHPAPPLSADRTTRESSRP